jgi:hypothetical protein
MAAGSEAVQLMQALHRSCTYTSAPTSCKKQGKAHEQADNFNEAMFVLNQFCTLLKKCFMTNMTSHVLRLVAYKFVCLFFELSCLDLQTPQVRQRSKTYIIGLLDKHTTKEAIPRRTRGDWE